MKNRPRFLDTGPPRRGKNVDAVAAANHHGTQSRRQPSLAKDNLRFGFLRQVAKRPLGLVAGDVSAPPWVPLQVRSKCKVPKI